MRPDVTSALYKTKSPWDLPTGKGPRVFAAGCPAQIGLKCVRIKYLKTSWVSAHQNSILKMIYDQWREQNSPGEVNPFPSLTQPCRVFSVMDYLTRPDLVLQERHPFAEIEVNPNDPDAFDCVPDPDDILDNFEYEVPRDPDLYGSAPVRRPTKPGAQANGSKDPKPGARSENGDGSAGAAERAPGAEENRVATEDK